MADKKDNPDTLAGLRDRIDSIDAEILKLLNDRASTAVRVADVKKAEAASNADASTGSDNNSNGQATLSFYRPEREARIYRALASSNPGPLHDEHLERIYKEVISACLSLEEQLTIGYLGPQGTYSEEATFKHFGGSVTGVPFAAISDIFSAVEAREVGFGVVPVENSTEGMVNHTLDLLMETSLRVCGEVQLRIQHQLLSSCKTLADVKAVHAHPQSLAQCRTWLNENMPNVERISESSNAAAAAVAVENDTIAAIASENAASQYQLNILAANIEDVKTNTTRFLVIGDIDVPPSGDDATSLLISAPHKPGGLRRMLKPLEDSGVSMTRIESRPARSAMWEYVFFIDLQGHQEDETLAKVLDQLRDEAVGLRVIGSYPRAT